MCVPARANVCVCVRVCVLLTKIAQEQMQQLQAGVAALEERLAALQQERAALEERCQALKVDERKVGLLVSEAEAQRDAALAAAGDNQ